MLVATCPGVRIISTSCIAIIVDVQKIERELPLVEVPVCRSYKTTDCIRVSQEYVQICRPPSENSLIPRRTDERGSDARGEWVGGRGRTRIRTAEQYAP